MIQKYNLIIIGSILVFAGCFIAAEVRIYQLQKEIQTIYQKGLDNKKLNFTIDSLNSEAFTKDIQIHRYEYILDEINSDPQISHKDKEIIDSILSHTE